MKRLLKISFDLSLLSFIPIISWFLLGIIVDKNLINIFTLTYPLQFIYYILKSIFSTGANINKEKDNNKNAVMSGMFIGTIVAIIIFLIILINIDNYIIFMNMDVNIYKTFTIYSVLQLFVCLEFAMILNKLYYEENLTLQEIADLENVSKSYVGNIIKKTSEKLKEYESVLHVYENKKLLSDALLVNDLDKIKQMIKKAL